MKKLILLTTLLIPFIIFSQAQLGSDINGEAASDYSGNSVSLSSDGTIVAIGANFNDGNGSNSGHVRVYEYSGSSWSQLGADINGDSSGDYSGRSVSLSSDGTIVAIGAYGNDVNGSNSGHVRVYSWNGSQWDQLGADINGEAASDASGHSVSLSSDGTIVAIGAYGNGGSSGHVRVYQYSGSSWTKIGDDIDGEAAYDYSGYSVSLSSDGTIVAIGARYNDGNGSDSGHVRVYEYSGSSWSQLGADINGDSSGDYSGYSVSLSSDGTIVAIGAPDNDGNGIYSGHVRVYEYSGSSWSQLGADINGEAASDQSGRSVSLSSDGTIVAIGATDNDGNGSDSGHVRVYEYSGSSWSQLGADIDGDSSGDYSGRSVSLSSDGTIVAVGAPYNDGNGSNSGHVRVYQYSDSSWSQPVLDIDGEAANDYSGHSVSLSSDGTIVAVGAPYNDGNTGHVRVYDIETPTISSVSLAADNSTITVTTSKSVYNSSGGSSDLEATDFALSISGGSATLTSATPTSISKTSQSIWVLGVGLSGTSTGGETLTVTPVANSIYYGTTAMSTTQTGNTASVNNIAPTFDAISLSVNNSSISVTASETLYTTTGGSGALVAADFAFSISGGTATLSSTTPTSISTTGLVTTLGIGLSGTPDGDEILKLNPASSSSIYDSGDTALSATIISTGVKLFPNTITATSLTSSAATTAGSLTVDNVVMDGATIGHSDDTDLMTLASGSLTVAGDIILSSDARLKSNIVTLGPTLISLMQLDAKRYTMKADKEQKQKIGLLAQEVQKVFPELVSEDKNGMLAVNYQALVPVLINALKEQEGNYKELEKELSELETLIKEK